MTVIHRYISLLFFKYFGIVLGVVIVIYLSIDFFGRIDKFLEAELALSLIVAFFLYKIPLIVSQIIPIAVLLGVLAAFGLMVKNNEILALKSGGISLHYLLLPIAVIGICLTIFLFIFSEVVVPISVVKANRIEEMTSRAKMTTSKGKNIWIRGNQSITHISYYNPVDQKISGISIANFNKEFSLTSRINAKTGKYIDGDWVFFDCLLQQHLNSSDEEQQVTFYDEKIYPIDLLPSDLLRVARESEELPFLDLYKYIQKVESQGYDAAKYRVDFYAKTAFPFICLNLSMLGAGLALRNSIKEGMAVSFSYGILTIFIYWSFYSFCLSIGYGNVLPPMLAAWSANIIFFCVAGLAVYNLE